MLPLLGALLEAFYHSNESASLVKVCIKKPTWKEKSHKFPLVGKRLRVLKIPNLRLQSSLIWCWFDKREHVIIRETESGFHVLPPRFAPWWGRFHARLAWENLLLPSMLQNASTLRYNQRHSVPFCLLLCGRADYSASPCCWGPLTVIEMYITAVTTPRLLATSVQH